MAPHASYNVTNGVDVSDAAALNSNKPFQRGYQACQPCRKRKVKCDLGPVDSPHDPPCARCRREHKDCVFEVTRRKRRQSWGEDALAEEEPLHLARKKSARRQTLDEDGQDDRRNDDQIEGYGPSPARSHLNGTTQHRSAHRGGDSEESQDNDVLPDDSTQDQEVINEEAARLLSGHLLGNDDALSTLHILAKAASAHKAEEGAPNAGAPKTSLRPQASSSHPHADANHVSVVDPAIISKSQTPNTPSPQLLSIWARFRMVQAGWLKAEEAIAFVDYYYKHLAPLTPVTHPDLRDLEQHPDFINEEPVLTLTILTIASRYAKIEGPGHDVRSVMIHVKLWEALEKMLNRMFWAQEQFGGGFCGAGATSLANKSKLRALGSIESLLLLTDFHPRALHFPPSVNDEDVLLEAAPKTTGQSSTETDTSQPAQSSIWQLSEPAVRSDRMSWSLICLAHTLAYELGVFGTFTQGRSTKNSRLKLGHAEAPNEQRIKRINRLLFIYMTQASGWYGFPGMYPPDLTERHLQKLHQGFGIDFSQLTEHDPVDVKQKFWVEVISINKYCNDVLFTSKQNADSLINSGEYAEGMGKLIPVLESWEGRLQNAKVDHLTKTMLSIEVNYFMMFVKSFPLQAVFTQVPAKLARNQHATEHSTPTSGVSSNFWQLYTDNQVHTRGFVEASRKILTHVWKDLLPNDDLKHAPVRVIFRIVSAALFLLKSFTLGAKRRDVDISMHLLKRTIKAFRTSVVDSVHLSLPIADLLEVMIQRMNANFIAYHPEIATSPTRASFSAAPALDTPQPIHQNTRFIRRSRAGSVSGPSYMNEPNSNVTVMPPPKGVYQNFDPSRWPPTPDHDFSHLGGGFTQQQQQQPGFATSPQPGSTSGRQPHQFSPFQPSDNDWIGVDLQHLINNNDTFLPANDPTLFGHPFDIGHENLEFLGRLVPEQDWTNSHGSAGGPQLDFIGQGQTRNRSTDMDFAPQ